MRQPTPIHEIIIYFNCFSEQLINLLNTEYTQKLIPTSQKHFMKNRFECTIYVNRINKDTIG